ncbi:TetR/AcrR family transcriptional regulator, partial [Leptospira ellisii]
MVNTPSAKKRFKDKTSVAKTRIRIPSQERSQNRMALVLDAAERLLVELGPEETSIPEIAKISGVPRASIYQFFPDKYALFTRLAEKHLT